MSLFDFLFLIAFYFVAMASKKDKRGIFFSINFNIEYYNIIVITGNIRKSRDTFILMFEELEIFEKHLNLFIKKLNYKHLYSILYLLLYSWKIK